MHNVNLVFSSRTAVAISAMLVSACGSLSHPTNNDGNDLGNALGFNAGTPTLSVSSDSSAIAVGSGAPIHVYYNQQPFPFATSLLTVVSSDSTKVGCCAYGASVGTATLTYFYNGLQASIDMSVHPNSAGAWARFTADLAANTGVPFWVPDSVQVPVGSIVEFSLSQVGLHNVVFDSVPGAPSDIPTATKPYSGSVARTFATPGAFRFRCTQHGETGVVVVSP